MRTSQASRSSSKPILGRALAAITAIAIAAPLLGVATAGAEAASAPVIVQAADVGAARAAVLAAGGQVDADLVLVRGVAARVSPVTAARLASDPSVAVTADAAMKPTGDRYDGESTPTQIAALHPGDSRPNDAGDGVAVALVDTGVATNDALRDNVVRGPDLSGEHNGIDRYGHGTFMAGLIAGVAPGAKIVSIKVAGVDGSTSLSKVINGIGYAITHRDDLHIKVLNLSFGVSSPVAYRLNPLDAAVEAAWASGLTVVTAAGNDGRAAVTSPGDDPYVITVGATDTHGTAGTADDTRPPWSSEQHLAPAAKPELLAPGVSVVSLRVPGSTIDRANPAARVGEHLFKGTGTSMSTALASGAATIVAWHHPAATPDDVKSALVRTAKPLTGAIGGIIDLAAADHAHAAASWQTYPLAYGPFLDGMHSMPWQAGSWTAGSWTAGSWTAGSWTAGSWTAGSWTAGSWTAGSWTAGSWTAGSWTAGSWTAGSWTAGSWTAGSWTAGSWTAGSWTADSWG